MDFLHLVKDDLGALQFQLHTSFLVKISSDIIACDTSLPFLLLAERVVVGRHRLRANRFIRMCPVDPALLVLDNVRLIRETLKHIDLPPFQRQPRPIVDRLTFLYDEVHILKCAPTFQAFLNFS
jgi:hypothetical protein